MIWLDASGRIAEIQTINDAHPHQKVGIITGEMGTPLVPAWLLDEAGPGQMWESWGDLLRSLPMANDGPLQ